MPNLKNRNPEPSVRNWQLESSRGPSALFSNHYYLVRGHVNKLSKKALTVFTSCGRLSITRRPVHNVVFTRCAPVFKSVFYTIFVQTFYSAFSGLGDNFIPLLGAGFYPQSTTLITKTTILNKKYVMEML